MSGVIWMAAQLMASAAKPVLKRAFNPNPPGSVKQGSCSDAVLCFLQGIYPRYTTLAHIIHETGRPPKSVSWSVHYLRSIHQIESRYSHDLRSPLYMQYRAVVTSDAGLPTTQDSHP